MSTIRSVERIPVDAGFTPRPEKHMARELWNWRISEVIRVTAENGAVGYGETLPHYTWGRVSEEAERKVLGRNPFDLLWDDSLGAGLQMAVWDLAGKLAEVPCHRFIGAKVRDECPISWWAIDMPPEDWAAEAMEASGLKTKKAVVEEALKLFVRLRRQERIKDHFGKLTSWEGSIDEMRGDRTKDWK